jgi:hypothetical protein
MKFKFAILNFIFIPILSTVFGQTSQQIAIKKMTDSLKMNALSDYATKYPSLRQGTFTTDIIGSRDVMGELNGQPLYRGKVNESRIRSNFNIPIAHWGKNTVSAALSYQQLHLETKNITSYNASFSNQDKITNRNTVGFTAVYSRSDSIFGHPISYSGGLSGVTNEFSTIKRVNYLGTITFPVSRSKYSSLTLGLVAIIDPSSVAPVIPIVSYWHKFKASDLDLYVDFPSRIALRKQLSKRSWAFIGSELGGNLYFFDLEQPTFPRNSIYTTIDVRTGGTLEYLLTKKLVLGMSGGLYTLASSKIFDHDAKPDAYFFKTNAGSVPYVSFSVSFLPFLKSLR